MDLVVTIHCTEVETFHQELLEQDVFKLNKMLEVPNLPQLLAYGDDIYFLIDGQVKYRGKYLRNSQRKYRCLITGRKWETTLLEVGNLKELTENQKVNMNGFEGYRYRSWGD